MKKKKQKKQAIHHKAFMQGDVICIKNIPFLVEDVYISEYTNTMFYILIDNNKNEYILDCDDKINFNPITLIPIDREG